LIYINTAPALPTVADTADGIGIRTHRRANKIWLIQPLPVHLTSPFRLLFKVLNLGLAAQSVEQKIENVGKRINTARV
jgi:hypothetical protein